MHKPHTAFENLLLYLQPRQLVVFALGLAQGAPFALIAGTLTYWLAKLGLDKSTVGLFGLAGLAYSLKFLWAPLLDRVRLPLLARLVGQRRAWLLVLQLALFAAISALGYSSPVENVLKTAALAALIGFLSASQDVIIDAFRIEILDDDEQGAGAAMIQFGWRIGALLAGAGTLVLAKRIGYPEAYLLSSFIILPGLIAAFLWGEPRHVETIEARRQREAVEVMLAKSGRTGLIPRVLAWVYMAAVAPFAEFMTRRGWYLILIFILLFKFGDAVAANQTSYFLFELGFDEDEMAWANKVAGTIPTLIGIALGGTLYFAVGAWRALFITGILMMVTNLMFVALAGVGHSVLFLMLTVGTENLASGLGGTAVVAYLSGLCNKSFTATQYALLSAVTLLPRSIFAGFSGFISERVDWPTFFIISTLAAIPGLMMLFAMRRVAFAKDGSPVPHDAGAAKPDPALP
ncbi:MAG: MFS transporter [Sphingomonadales bacterium]